MLLGVRIDRQRTVQTRLTYLLFLYNTGLYKAFPHKLTFAMSTNFNCFFLT